MNKRNQKNEMPGALSFKRETVRSLSADEIRQAAGGLTCVTTCRKGTCPGSVCTYSIDPTE